MLTGDTLFVGDVGRPDLRASLGWSATELGANPSGAELCWAESGVAATIQAALAALATLAALPGTIVCGVI